MSNLFPAPAVPLERPELAPGRAARGQVPRWSAGALLQLTGLFLLSRLLVLAVSALARSAFIPGLFGNADGRTWIERFVIWDATWYRGIATKGYYYHSQAESSVGFYPLYPWLMHVGTLVGWDVNLTGYAVSLVSLFGACLLLWKLSAWETGAEAVADRAVLFLLFCPGSVWFGLMYTESLFLLTMLGCLWCARRGRWIAAGACGLAAALTRTPGLLLAGFIFLEAAQQWWERRGAVVAAAGSPPEANPDAKPFWKLRVALGVAGPIAGHASFLLFLQLRFGDWRAQQRTMAAGWHGVIQWPWDALRSQWALNEPFVVAVSTPLLFLTLALALASGWTLRRWSYAALVFALCTLYVCATPGDALTRYLSTAAPVYIVLAQLAIRSRLLELTALIFSVALLTLITALLASGYHIT